MRVTLKTGTVSNTYAWEIQTDEYGEGIADHLRYHNNKILGIVNGIDTDIWNPATDKLLAADYDEMSVIKNKKVNKKALQESLGLDVDEHKMVIGLISRLTNQKGLDLVNDVIPGIMDEHTQVVVLGTGDSQYENTFRYYENKYNGNFCAYITYNENVAHNIYAGCDALLVPSRFEPCGLTQLARGLTLTQKDSAYLMAAKLAGSSTGKLLIKHILPNIAGPVLVTAVLDIGTMMMELAGLSFLGLGVKPPMAEWGSMINDGRSMLQISPWMVLAPGAAIFVTVMIFNLLGDTVRDYMDPKERNRRK